MGEDRFPQLWLLLLTDGLSVLLSSSPIWAWLVSLSPLVHSCPFILDNNACFFVTKKWMLSGRNSLNFPFFLSAIYILTYDCSHPSYFPLQLFFFLIPSPHTLMPLHTYFRVNKSPFPTVFVHLSTYPPSVSPSWKPCLILWNRVEPALSVLSCHRTFLSKNSTLEF